MGVTISGRDSVAWTASRLSLSFLVVLFLFFNRVAAVDNVTNPISLFKSVRLSPVQSNPIQSALAPMRDRRFEQER